MSEVHFRRAIFLLRWNTCACALRHVRCANCDEIAEFLEEVDPGKPSRFNLLPKQLRPLGASEASSEAVKHLAGG